MKSEEREWPAQALSEWSDTCATLHMWTQIVGKVRLALAPLVNHWWNVPLYVDAEGLTTSMMAYGTRGFEMRFDFVAHELVIETTFGERKTVALAPRTTADFYQEVMSVLGSLGFEVSIWTTPVEVPNPIPFEKDTVHRSYDAPSVERFFAMLVQSERVLEKFRSRFIGKCSPIHFFWGGFDLAVTRFSGRLAPPHGPVPNTAASIVREAYSHEVSSAGFCPGYGAIDAPFYYSYAYPEPPGFASAALQPREAHYEPALGEAILPYDVVRTAGSPDETLLAFLESSYAAAADLGHWDRANLERAARPRPPSPRAEPLAGFSSARR